MPNGQDQISTSTRRDALGKRPTHSNRKCNTKSQGKW